MSEGGGRASAQKHHAASSPGRTARAKGENQAAETPHPLLRLQLGAGNQAVKALLGGGSPLPEGLRTEMEQRFGADFDDVRIHDSAAAHAAAKAMGAKAFTYGTDVVFSQDRFAPGTADGRKLIAHELAHVVQQVRPSNGLLLSRADAEVSAHNASRTFAETAHQVAVIGSTSPQIAKEEDKQAPMAVIIRDEDLSREQLIKKRKIERGNKLGNIHTPESRANDKRFIDKEIAKYYGEDRPPGVNVRYFSGTTSQGREEKQGTLRVLAYENDPDKIPPKVQSRLRNQLEGYYDLMRDGKFQENEKKNRIGLPDDYQLAHYEAEDERNVPPYWDQKDGEPASKHTPAREGYDYGPDNTRVIPKEQNAAEEKRRRKNLIARDVSAKIRGNGDKPGAVPPIIRKRSDQLEPPKLSPPPAPKPKKPSGVREVAINGPSGKPSLTPLTFSTSPDKRPSPAAEPKSFAPSKESQSVYSPKTPPAYELLSEPSSVMAPPNRMSSPKSIPKAFTLTPPIGSGPVGPGRRVQIYSLHSLDLEVSQGLRHRNIGSIVGILAGFLSHYALSKYAEWMNSALEARLPLKEDAKSWKEYQRKWPDSIRFCDLLVIDTKELAASLGEMSQTADEVMGEAVGSILDIGLSQGGPTERLERIQQADELIGIVEKELASARQAINNALALEPQGHDSAAAATELADWIDPSNVKGDNKRNSLITGTAWYFLIYEAGLDATDIMSMELNLRSHASKIEVVLSRINDARNIIEPAWGNAVIVGSKVNRLLWAAFLEVLASARRNKGSPM